ncbi:MAG: S1 RNA-binding domain-containing protein [Romboutsia sp.]|nr:S1 RNA-binding domain-containing protein [Romboutsia sp.]
MKNELKTLNLNESLLECDNDLDILNSYNNENDIKNELIKCIGTNQYFSGLCTRCDSNGNLTVEVNGVECIIEAQEISSPLSSEEKIHKGVGQNKVGSYIKAKVLKYENDTVYLTRREFVEKIREVYNQNLTVGMSVKGRVTNIDENKGVFVNIGGDYVGIIPRNLLENLYVTKLGFHVSIDETVEAVVTELLKNDEGNIVHLVLDRKSLLPSFQKLVKKYNRGDVVIGTVKSIQKTGIYCAIDKHLDIICDFNSQTYKPNDKVRVRINTIKYDKRIINGAILSQIK